MRETKLLDLNAVADKLGLTYATVRGYHGTAEHRRKYGTDRPGDFPPPDHHFGRSPVWAEGTIDEWISRRPGRGVGGGRPRKESS